MDNSLEPGARTPKEVDTLVEHDPEALQAAAAKEARCRARGRCFYGNVVLGCGGCIVLVAMPGQSFGLSMFVDDMLQDLEISRSQVSWTWMIALLVSSIFLPVAGYIFDRYGAKALLLLNIAPLVFSTALVSRATGTWSLGACFCGMRLFGPEVCELLAYCVVNMWFVQNRARAASILMTVDSSLLATPPLLLGLKSAVGWRTSFVVLGAMQGCILVVCWLLMVDRPEDMGLQPDGVARPQAPSTCAGDLSVKSTGSPGRLPSFGSIEEVELPGQIGDEEQLAMTNSAPVRADQHISSDEEIAVPSRIAMELSCEDEDWPFREIVREKSFCMLILCFGCYRVFRAGMNMHIVNVFEEKGSNAATASFVYSVITAGSIIATLGFPKICHIFENRIRLMGFVYCLGATAMGAAGLMGPSNHWLVCWVFAALYGVFWGVVGTISGTIFADLFGRSSLGMTRSILGWISTIASGCGTLIFSTAREQLGSYDSAILPIAGVVGIFAMALLGMGHPQRTQSAKRSAHQLDAVSYNVVGKAISEEQFGSMDSSDVLPRISAPGQ